MKNRIIYFLVLLLFFGCKNPEISNIYYTLSKNSKFKYSVFLKTKQIMINDTDIIMLYNFTNYSDVYIYHLLFYNKNFRLKSACYLPTHNVDSIVDGVIYCCNFEKGKSIDFYIRELPNNYSICYTNSIPGTGAGRKSDKLVEKIELKNDRVTLFVKKSNNMAIGLSNYDLLDDSIFISNFNIKDTLSFKINELFLLNDENSIMTEEYYINDYDTTGFHIMRDYILVPESIFIDFYKQILATKL